jgi:hypothetical protein
VAYKNRTERGATLSAAITEEARFIWKNREHYRPGLSFVSPPEPVVDTGPAVSRDLALALLGLDLDQVGLPGSFSVEDALRLLSEARGTARELPLVEALLWKSVEVRLPVVLRQTCADILAARGYLARALAVLAEAGAESAPVMSAPPDPAPRVDDPDPGVAAAAVAAALSRDIEAPGMRERHARAQTLARAARLSLEVFQSLGGRSKRDELHRAGRELEELGESSLAGEAYALAGDQAARARVGAPAMEPVDAEAPAILVKIGTLDRRGRRLEAIAAARAWLANQEDEYVAAAGRGVFARLLRGPAVDLESDGCVQHYLLGPEITIGRVGASIALSSPAVTRRHARLRREGGRPVLEDLESHNGTSLGGAQIAAPLPIGAGLSVVIAGHIPCLIRPMGDDLDGPLLVDIAEVSYIVPLGEARIGALRLGLEAAGDQSIVTLRAAAGAWVALGGTRITPPIELCEGDVIRHGNAPGSSFQVVSG